LDIRHTEFPKGVSPMAFNRIPPKLLDDAIQEAWLAVAEGRSPNGAVVNFLRRERRRRKFLPLKDRTLD
jgi:hypothetical protein